MADSILTTGFSYFGWTFLPSYATNLLQTLYYRVTIRAGQRHPQPGEPLWQYHHRRIRVLVLTLYLLYTFFQALHDIKIAGDFYVLLGVTPDSTDREIKARFRRLAARLHPDKIRPETAGGYDGSAAGTSAAEAVFVQLKLAQDTILDPAKRFAYDRFGPVIVRLEHPNLKTIRDYVYAGLTAKAPEYGISALSLVFLNYIWLPKWGQFWRYLVIAALAGLELYFLTHDDRAIWPSGPRPLSSIRSLGWFIEKTRDALPSSFAMMLPSYLLPFQILTLAHRMSMSLNIFISQLAPPSSIAGRTNAQQSDRMVSQQVAYLAQGANKLDAEANGLLQLELTPFKDNQEKTKVLRSGMKDVLIMSAIRNHPEVRETVRRVMDRRKME